MDSDPKSMILNQIRSEAAITNARALINNINQNCFEKCVPTPNSTLSKKEDQCFVQCMDKYMAAWNAVSRAYVSKIPRSGGGELADEVNVSGL